MVDCSTETNRFNFHRIDDEWKLDVLALINPDSLYFTNTVTEPDGSERAVVTKLNIEESKQRKLVPETNSP